MSNKNIEAGRPMASGDARNHEDVHRARNTAQHEIAKPTEDDAKKLPETILKLRISIGRKKW
jgi:hypothetical protein